MKRGEISWEVIILGAVGLLVLVVLSILIIRAGGEAGQECRNIGGTCVAGEWTDSDVCSGYGTRSPNSCGEGSVCCVRLFGGEDEYI